MHADPEAQQGAAEQAQPGHPVGDCGGGQSHESGEGWEWGAAER